MRALVAIGPALMVAALSLTASSGCSSDPEATAAPTRDSLAADWNIVLPDTVTDFLATTVGERESHVSFGLAAADVDPMLSASGLEPVDGERVVTHASPLWDLNPAGEIAGGTDTVQAGRRAVEVVTAGGTVTFRAVLTRSG